MAEKKNNYETIVNAFAESGLSDDEIAKAYPEIWAWWNSASDEASRAKRLESKMGNEKFQKELRDWDAFANEDFSGYKEEPVPSNMEEATMKDVEEWYKKAKHALDPKGRLGDTELWDTAGDATFQQLEEKIGEDYSGDWFGNLIDAFGYPDTAEGYEQLTQDLQTVFNRKRNADKAEKYGPVVDFVMGNSMNTMKEGFKPTLGDIVSDAVANAAWGIPGLKFTKAFEAVAPASRLYQASKAMDRGHKAFGMGTRLAAKTVENSSAPIINEVSKALLASNVPDGSNDAGVGNVLRNTLTNAAIMKILPGAIRTGEIAADGLGFKPGELSKTVDDVLSKAQKVVPVSSSYLINRAGNDNVAGWLFNRITAPASKRFGIGSDEE